MKSWQQIITEAKSKREKELEQRVSELGDVPQSLKGKDKKQKSKKKSKKSEYTKYLEKQLEYKKQKYEDQKKRQIEKLKERGVKSHTERAKEAIRGIKYQSVGYKDPGATADAKAISNVGSALKGIGTAAYHGVRALQQKKKNELEAQKAKETQPEKKEPKKSGRPPMASKESGEVQKPTNISKQISGTPERKKLVPSTKRLMPATKKLPPSGGSYDGPQRGSGMTLGQRARRNPELKKKLISTRNQTESYSNWREEFEFIAEVEKYDNNKKDKKEIIDVMNGKKNKITINPTFSEEKDDEGGMVYSELSTMERAIKALRNKIKSPNQQLPAWVQSKITKAADYIGTASDYIQSGEKVDESADDLNEIAPIVSGLARVAASSATRSAATGAASSSLKKRLTQKAGELALDKVKTDIQNKFTNNQSDPILSSPNEPITKDDSESSAYRKIISKVAGIRESKSPSWTRKEGKNKNGGLNEKGRKSYERENPGSDLKRPQPEGGSRRDSFCARMKGMKKKLTSAKTANDPDSRINKSLRAWNC